MHTGSATCISMWAIIMCILVVPLLSIPKQTTLYNTQISTCHILLLLMTQPINTTRKQYTIPDLLGQAVILLSGGFYLPFS